MLTAREREVAALVAWGLANKDIASRLVVSKRTVDAHIEHILGKLGYGSRVQIAALAAGQRDQGQRDPGQRDPGQRDQAQRDQAQRDQAQRNKAQRDPGSGPPVPPPREPA
jgi:DNA-binding CsgD family transcriptional regulator